MKPSELALKLGVDRKTITRYITKGLLAARSTKSGYEISPVEANNLKAKLESRKKLDERVKELFVLRTYETSLSHIQDEYGLSPDDIVRALKIYRFDRSQYIKKFNLKVPVSDILLVDEVTARLKVTDRHIAYHLKDLGELVMYENVWRGKKRFFPSKHSFGEYLGADVTTIFYNSREVSEKLGISIERIDRIAKRFEIGRKIKNGHDNSNYLFTPEDVNMVRYHKNNHRKK
ncbi:MAG: hypothetical protein AABY14_01990 [Nanoarchaeota archaeon]